MYTLPNTGASDLCSRNLISRPNESGYLCTIPATSAFSSLYFFIPATGEMRLLSNFIRPYSNHAEDGGGGVVPVFHNSFDSRDPLVFYAIVETGIGPYYRAIIRGKYTGNFSSKLRDYSTAAEDVITWTNLTPKSAGRDLVSQLAARRPDYRSAIFPYFQAVGVTGNKFVFTVSSGQDSPCLIGLTDLSTGDVTVRDSWSDSNGRWGACHALQVTAEGWMLANMNPSRYSSSDQALSGPWRLRVAAVYKNNQPSADTSITPSLAEACPSDLDSAWTALGATGKQCIRIITDGEPCSATPAKAETTQFPCPQSGEASLLQPLAEGDILADLQTNLLSERFRIVRKRMLNNNQLELTLQRRAFCTEGLPDNWFAHADGFGLSASQSGGCYSAGWWLKADQPASPWLIENPILPSGHFDIGAGSAPGRLTSITGLGASYLARFDQATPGQFGQSLPIQINASPRFAGSTASIEQANEPYPSIRQWNASVADKRWMLDFAAYQPGQGPTNETSLSLFENSITLVPKTSTVYLISNPRSGLNRKTLPVIAWAGRYWLRDISGPNSLITDEQAYSFCIADQADECRPGSAVNQAFVNVPRATIAAPKPYCGTNHYASSLPCLLTANAIGGSVLQWDVSKNDPEGLAFRRITMGFSGPGRQYTFSNARATPDGGWVMLPGFWLDGYRTDLLLAKLPPWPASDTIRRDDFQMVERTIITTENAPRVRLRFGYAENGAPESLYCTTRRESCVASGTPFSWLHEAPLGIACDGSCTVHIPSLSGRVLYYQVDRLSSTGSPVSSDPLIAVAIP